MIVIVIRYKTKATARRALTFIVRIFVNDTIAIAVWTNFHGVCIEVERSPSEFLGCMGMMRDHHGQLGGLKALPVPFGGSCHRLGGVNEPIRPSLAQIVQHIDSLIRCREVQIGSFPTHVLQD